MPPYQVAAFIKAAFEEGYGSYATACNAMNSVEEAWKESTAKEVCDGLLNAPSSSG